MASNKLEASTSQVAFDTNRFAVNAASAEFSGVLRCDTLIANSVVASNYTPGAGNVL